MPILDFPGSPVANNMPANTGDTDFIPGPGSFHKPCNYWAHVLQLLKPACSKAHAPQPEKPQWEAHASQLESSLHLPPP